MWRYKSPIGNIYIKYLPEHRAYGTIYNGIVWETCDNPQASADNVYCHCTGCPEWDMLCDIDNVPTDLSEWENVNLHSLYSNLLLLEIYYLYQI